MSALERVTIPTTPFITAAADHRDSLPSLWETDDTHPCYRAAYFAAETAYEVAETHAKLLGQGGRSLSVVAAAANYAEEALLAAKFFAEIAHEHDLGRLEARDGR